MILLGDITLLNLGLSDDEYMYLSYEVDIIIHSAATVNLIYPYRALHSSNVVGTDNILKFSLTNKIKPLHHIRYMILLLENILMVIKYQIVFKTFISL